MTDADSTSALSRLFDNNSDVVTKLKRSSLTSRSDAFPTRSFGPSSSSTSSPNDIPDLNCNYDDLPSITVNTKGVCNVALQSHNPRPFQMQSRVQNDPRRFLTTLPGMRLKKRSQKSTHPTDIKELVAKGLLPPQLLLSSDEKHSALTLSQTQLSISPGDSDVKPARKKIKLGASYVEKPVNQIQDEVEFKKVAIHSPNLPSPPEKSLPELSSTDQHDKKGIVNTKSDKTSDALTLALLKYRLHKIVSKK